MSATTQIEAFIYIDHRQILIKGEYTPGMKGPKDKYGAPEAPDDEEEIVFLEATDSDGDDIELSKHDEGRAMDALWDQQRKEQE